MYYNEDHNFFIYSDPKLENIKPILPIMREIAQWAIFNKLTQDETNMLKFPEIWKSTCHVLKAQSDAILTKQLFTEVKKCMSGVLEYYHCGEYSHICWKMLEEINRVLMESLSNHISKVDY